MPELLTDPKYTTRDDIEYYERGDGYDETWGEEQSVVTREFLCRWSDRRDFKKAILADAEYFAGSISRQLPQADPYWEGLYADSMKLITKAGYPTRGTAATSPMEFADRDTGSGSEPTDGLAAYLVTFRPTMYNLLTDEEITVATGGEMARYTFETTEPSATVLTVPAGELVWKSDLLEGRTVAVGQEASRLLAIEQVNLHWLMVPKDAWEATELAVMSYVNFINDTVFLGREVGTMLADVPKKRLYTHANGKVYYDIVFVYMHRPNGWNFLPRPSASGIGFEEVVRLSDPTKGLFEKTDLTAMFPSS